MDVKTALDKCKELIQGESYDKADAILSSILAKDPMNFNGLQLLGLVKAKRGDFNAACQLTEKALSQNPDNPSVNHNIAGIYRTLGRLRESEDSFRRAIQLKPDYAESYLGLSELVKFKKNDPLLDVIEKQAKKTHDPEVGSYLHFAAGKIYDDYREYKKAYYHYRLGNMMDARLWNQELHQRNCARIRAVYQEPYFRQHSGNGLGDYRPIFIVGMPRSGSTLLEQILGAHSALFAVGELNDIQSISEQIDRYSSSKLKYPECMPALPLPARKGLGISYRKRVYTLREKGVNASCSIDKNIFNFIHLGLIVDLFPNARIIHIRRNPIDTCLSCYFQKFSNGVEWSFNWNHICTYYQTYQQMMAHWQTHLPLNYIELKYEKLVSDSANVIKNLLQLLDLPWEDECLQYHEKTGIIQTASAWQARQPIYRNSLARWHHYRDEIYEQISPLHACTQAYEKAL